MRNYPVAVEILGLARGEDPPVEDGGRVDEEHYHNGDDYLARGRYGSGAVLRQQGSGRERQAASRRCQDELREEVQTGRLRKQSSERGGQAALRCGQEQLHDEVHEERLDRVVQGLGFDSVGFTRRAEA